MLKKYYSSNPDKRVQQLTACLVVVVIVAIGLYLLIGSHAASPYISTTADSGTLSGVATTQSCSGASDGECVLFGASNVPKHIETWAYDDSNTSTGCNGGYGASAALVQQWLTYAETNCGGGNTVALNNCHAGGVTYCKVMAYNETNLIYSNSPLRAACSDLSCYPEDFWLHEPGYTDSAHRLTINDSYDTTADYYLNQLTPAADTWFQNYVRTNFASYDGLMMDDTGDTLSGLIGNNNQGASSSEEITSDAQIIAEHDQMAGYMTKTDSTPFLQVDNGIDTWPLYPQGFNRLDSAKDVDGLLAEGSPISNDNIGSDPEGYPEYAHADKYATLLDDMAYVGTDANTDSFIVLLSYDSSDSSPGGSGNQLMSRRVQAATVLLGYSPGHVVSWSDLEQNNDDLAIWPEEGIYPMNPVQSMSSPSGSGCLTGNNGNNGFGNVCSSGGHNDIQVASGIYRREFKDCYNQGKAFGPCAVIVNDTPSAVTVQSSWLTQSYSHQIALVGGDVQSGGTIDLNGASFTPNSTTIAAYDAAFLAP